MTVHAHRPSVKGRTSYSELPEGVNPFVFTLGAYGIRGSVKLDLRVMLTLHREGRIVLQETSNWDRPVIRNGIPAEGITVSIQDIADRIAGWCVSPDVWEVVGMFWFTVNWRINKRELVTDWGWALVWRCSQDHRQRHGWIFRFGTNPGDFAHRQREQGGSARRRSPPVSGLGP
jgi:hypothetical protein